MKQSLRLAVGVLAVCVIAWFGKQFTLAPVDAAGSESSGEGAPRSLIAAGASLGLLILGSWLFGQFVKTFRLPRVSGYLVLGVLVGPHILQLVTKEQIPHLRLVNDLALAVIALTAGGEIELGFLRRALRAVISLAMAQMAAVFVVVGGAAWLAAPALGLVEVDDHTGRWVAAMLLGFIATASSPAVVVAMISELRARGPFAEFLLTLTVCKDLLIVALFTIVLAIGDAALPGVSESAADAGGAPADLIRGVALNLGGSVAAGVVVGLVFAWWMHTLQSHLAIVIVLASFAIALLSDALHLEALVVALVAGVLMRNLWEEATGPLFDAVEDLSLPVYCVFFAVAGAKLPLDALASLWPAATVFVLLRAAATWASVTGTARLLGSDPTIRKWLWTGLVSQAGVSLVLITIVQTNFATHAFAEPLFGLVVAMIGAHELIGPILLKVALTRVSGAKPEGDAAEPGGERTRPD